MKKLFTKEFKIGLWVIIGLVILIFGIDFLKGINLFTPTNYYIARYDNVQGIEISAPVTIDGYKVGQVREVKFDYEHPGKIEIVLALNKNLKVPEDSYAQLTPTMLSGTMIEMHLGKSKNFLPVGSEIKSLEAHDLMSSLQSDVLPTVNDILPMVDSLLKNLNTLVADPALAQSIGRLDGITANLLQTSQGLNTTMNRSVPMIMNNAGRITTSLDTVVGNLGTLSYQLKQLPLNATMDNVQAVTANLEAFSNDLRNKNSTLGMLMKDPELYNRLNRVAADVDSLIVDIKANPKRYISIKLL
ncbi:MAG: MCE family protein [Bacteroides sp.]|nr:MCE family protein [Bacteroides sp.]